MATQSEQNFGNHAKFTPLYHFVLGPIVIELLVWSAIRAMNTRTVDAHIVLLAAIALVVVFALIRTFPLKLQDRIIRLEEQVRMMRLLPPDLQARIGEFTVDQLVALRFASDAELPELARKVLTDRMMTRKEIKAQVKSWRADNFRI